MLPPPCCAMLPPRPPTAVPCYPPPNCRRILRYLYGDHLKRCWLLQDVKPKFFDALLGSARLETFMPQVCWWVCVERGGGLDTRPGGGAADVVL